jgi:hypothetical protein
MLMGHLTGLDGVRTMIFCVEASRTVSTASRCLLARARYGAGEIGQGVGLEPRQLEV